MNPEDIDFRTRFVKTLSAVEARPERSNQHEFNGVHALKQMFGLDRFQSDAVFSLAGADAGGCTAGVTWYDAREAHETRSEHRLYFKTNPIMTRAEEGDNVIIGIDRQNVLRCVLVKRGSDRHTGHIEGWHLG